MTRFPRLNLLLALLLAAPPAARGEGARRLVLTGELQPQISVRVYPKVAGIVTKIHFREGTIFPEGAVIAEIDPAEYELAVAEARAALEQAKARLAAMDAGGRPEERARASAEVDSAQAVFKNAKLNLDRLSSLAAKGGAPGSQVDDARREFDVAQSRLMAARKQLSMVKEGPRPEEKRAARAEVERAEAALKLAELRLDYTKIRAPFDGGIGMKLIDEGTYVQAGSQQQSNAVAVFSNSMVLKGILDIPERDLPFVRIGQPVRVSVQAMPGQTFPGTVSNLYPYVDPKTRLGKVEVRIPNNPLKMIPGMFVKAELDAAPAAARSIQDILYGYKSGDRAAADGQ